MKPISILLLLLIPFLSINGCKKEEKTGNLVVNARDGAGTSLDGEEVFLYNNQADFNNRIYSSKKVADNSGQVKFLNLKPGVYFVDCDFINQLNQTITISGSASVSAGYETTLTIKP